MKNYKKIMSVVFLASAVGYTGVVSAHTAEGFLGKSTSKLSATDVWKLDCLLFQSTGLGVEHCRC